MTDLSIKTKLIIATAVLALVFAGGRYSVSVPPPSTKTITSISTDTKTDIDKNTHKVTTVTSTKKPTGDEVVTTVITEDTNTESHRDSDSKSNTATLVTSSSRKTLNVSLLAGTSLHAFGVPIYGASVSKELLGPVTLGVWALTNSTVGVSVGIDF